MEYAAGNVIGVHHSLKKQERKRKKWEGEVREVEEVVGGMDAKLNKSPERGHRAPLSLDRAYAYSLLAYVIPQWLLESDAPHHRGIYGPSLCWPTSTIASRRPHHHYQHASFPSSPTTPLETIVEENDSTTANGKCQEISVPAPCAPDVDYFEHYYSGGVSSNGAFEGGY